MGPALAPNLTLTRHRRMGHKHSAAKPKQNRRGSRTSRERLRRGAFSLGYTYYGYTHHAILVLTVAMLTTAIPTMAR